MVFIFSFALEVVHGNMFWEGSWSAALTNLFLEGCWGFVALSMVFLFLHKVSDGCVNARPKFAASHVIHKSFARRSEVQVQGDASAVCELDLLAIRVWQLRRM